MVLFGEIIDAVQAERWGLVGWRVDGPALPEAERLITLLAARAPLAVAAAKRALVAGEESALAFREERRLFENLLDSADKKEGITAFRTRRKPLYEGK